jgi:hypothetical protein
MEASRSTGDCLAPVRLKFERLRNIEWTAQDERSIHRCVCFQHPRPIAAICEDLLCDTFHSGLATQSVSQWFEMVTPDALQVCG